MIPDLEWFAASFLRAPLGQRTERGSFTAHTRLCVSCKQFVYLTDPLALAESGRVAGHLDSCRALFIYYNGFDGQGGGGGANVTLARIDITLADSEYTLATLND